MSSRDRPPEHGHGRQQDLVGSSAGEHLREVRRDERAEVDPKLFRLVEPERARARSPRATRCPPPAPHRPRPAGGNSSQRGRGLIGPRMRGSVGTARHEGPAPAARRHPTGRSRRIRTWPICNFVTKAHRRDAIDTTAVDVRPVGAPQVLEVPAPTAVGHDRVLGRGERVIDDDRVVDVPAERRDDVETEGVALGRLTARRLQDDQPARPIGGLPSSGPQVAQQGADDPEEEEVQQAAGRAAAPPTRPGGTRPSAGTPRRPRR